MNTLSLKSLDTKHTHIHFILGAILLVLLSIKLDSQLYQWAHSVPGRILLIIGVYWLLHTYGILSGVLGALVMIVILMNRRSEGLENKSTSEKNKDSKKSKNSKDSKKSNNVVNDAVKEVNESFESKNENEDEQSQSQPIESSVAQQNDTGTVSQIDRDRAMKMSSLVNSNDDKTIEQMKAERQTEQEKEKSSSKQETFLNMGTLKDIRHTFMPF